jgi:hypothetical protein
MSLLGCDLLRQLLNLLIIGMHGEAGYVSEVVEIAETSIGTEGFTKASIPVVHYEFHCVLVQCTISDLNVGYQVALDKVINISLGASLDLGQPISQISLA